MVQEIAWMVSAAIIVAFAVTFVWVAMNAKDKVPYESVLPKGGGIRRMWFIALAAFGVIVTASTLPMMPYPAAQATPAPVQTVTAIGKQWSWDISATEIKAGVPVEFRVTSSDVNHGLGIYDVNLRLVAQTQAMPGYVNRIRHTFTTPGRYKLLCMEYCGLIHHDMMAEIVVKPN